MLRARCALRLPFRFGVITVTRSTQASIRATIALEDGRTSVGVAAETLGAKWFDKSPAFSDAQNLDQLRQSLALRSTSIARRGGARPSASTPAPIAEQMARGADLGLVPLVAAYGPALLDRAILDALGRADRPLLCRADPPQRRRHRRRPGSRRIWPATICRASWRA